MSRDALGNARNPYSLNGTKSADAALESYRTPDPERDARAAEYWSRIKSRADEIERELSDRYAARVQLIELMLRRTATMVVDLEKTVCDGRSIISPVDLGASHRAIIESMFRRAAEDFAEKEAR